MNDQELMQMMKALSDEIGMAPEDLLELYDTFIEEMTDEIFRLKIAYQKGDFLDLKNISHNIKGVSANLKFEAMFVESRALNDKLKAEAFDDDLYSHIDKLAISFNAFKAAFAEHFNR